MFEPGTAEIEKSGGGLTVRATVVARLIAPLVPVMVSVKVPIWAVLAVFTVSVGYAAYWRRMRLPPDKRLSLTVEIAVPNWTEYGGLDKGLTIALSASIIVAGGTLAYVVLTPPPGETFTQFYILGPGGNASGYPMALNISQPGSVILGIASHEATTVTYNVRVDLIGVRLVYNTTSGFNETVEVNRTTGPRSTSA